ncbi:MAG: LCP family protein [Spirochaetales bacterium]|nr:LCP family protein [Spirochaetales bacterium]
MRKENSFDSSFLFLLLLAVVFTALVIFMVVNIRVDEFTEAMKNQNTIVSAFVVSEEGKPLVTEIFFYDNVTGRGALYNIPENMGTLIQNVNKMDRLDSLFDEGDPLPYVEKIGALLGIEIDFYFHWDMEDLVKAVDTVEGIRLFIPNPVWQVSESDLNLLPSGSVVLDGDKTRTFLSYKLPGDTENDLITRKHDFTKAFMGRLGDMYENLEDERYGDLFYSYLDSNLDRQAFQSYLQVFESLDTDRLVLQKVLGKNRIVDGNELLFPYYDEKLMREMTRQIVDTLSNMEVYSDEDIVISVEIRNGTDIAGLASRTAQLYKSYGYKINAYKNADRDDYENTLVLERKGNPGAAKRVASLIRCDRVHQLQQDIADDTVDVVIILGKDFDGRYVKK